jgi:ParB-like nuclease domain
MARTATARKSTTKDQTPGGDPPPEDKGKKDILAQYPIERIAISSIVTDGKIATNYRADSNDAELKALGDSIVANGLLNPIIVVQDDDDKSRLHLAAGKQRLLASSKAGFQQITARVLPAKALGKNAQQTAVIARSIENKRKGTTFGDTVRSVRQASAAGVSLANFAVANECTQDYLTLIQKIDTALMGADIGLKEGQCWEDQVTGGTAVKLSSYTDIPAAFRALMQDGKLPPKNAENSRAGKGGAASAVRARREVLIAAHPWMHLLPWELLRCTKDDVSMLDAWAAEFERRYVLKPSPSTPVSSTASVESANTESRESADDTPDPSFHHFLPDDSDVPGANDPA